MKVKYKFILWFCLFLLIIIGVCLHLIRRENRVQNGSQSVKEGPIIDVGVSATISHIQNTQKYVSESRKFELNFPPSWGEVQITNTDVVGGKATMFSFKTTDSKFSGGVATAVTIYEYLLSTDLKTGIQIAADENYSYSYTTWESAPNDHQQITEKELADVLKTFKLTR